MTDTDGRPRSTAAVLRRLLMITGVTVLAGLLVAGLLLPPVAGVGLAGKVSADHFLALPTELVEPPLPQDSRILAADGSVIAVLRGPANRRPVPFREMPKSLRDAVVAIEDSRFYTHNGVDPQGLLRAALRNTEAGGVKQGGSTLTQQYVKNVLIEQAPTDQERKEAASRSIDRKLREARYALALERRLTKDEILERYLNIAYFGSGGYGVGVAAQRYFDRPVSRLTLAQSALLAGLVQSPGNYDPYRYPDTAVRRRDVVLRRMAELGMITQPQAAAAQAAPLGVVRTPPPSVPDACEASSAPFFCDYVRRGLRADPALGATQEERDRRVYQGGLTIGTTLDPTVQAAAQQAVDQTVPRDNRVAAVEVVVQPGTGNVLAMAVNRGYGGDPARGQTKQPLPTTAAFQPGSTFKVFTLAAALEQGYGIGTSFFAPACYVSPLYRIGGGSGRQDGGGCADGFSNADPGEAGVYDMSRGTWLSVNTYFIQLEERVGVRAVADMAVRLGVPASRLAGVGPNDGSLTIGTRVVSPLDMATAYATVAAHGLRCAPRWATSATDGNRRPLTLAAPPPCQQVLPAGVADTVTSVLEGVVTQGTGKNAAIGRPAAGKTGTTEGYSSAWYVGYTPDLVAAVEVGDPRGPVRYPLRDVTAAGQTYAQVYGGDLPALIWSRSVAQALADRPVTDFAAADPSVAAGTRGGSVDGAAPGGDYGRPGRGFPGGGTGGGGTGGGGFVPRTTLAPRPVPPAPTRPVVAPPVPRTPPQLTRPTSRPGPPRPGPGPGASLGVPVPAPTLRAAPTSALSPAAPRRPSASPTAATSPPSAGRTGLGGVPAGVPVE